MLRDALARLLGHADAPTRVLPLDGPTFRVAVAQPGRDIVVDFWAPGCAACEALAPSLERLAHEHPELSVASLDVERAPRTADRYRIERLPTIIRFRDGRPVARTSGAMAYDELVEALGIAGEAG